jgi:hypothetical protein
VGEKYFTGFGSNDGALAYQAGVGGTLENNSWLGARIDARLIRIGDVTKPGTTGTTGLTTNEQITVGLVFWF